MARHRRLLAALLALPATLAAQAPAGQAPAGQAPAPRPPRVLEVPARFPTIQAAIDSARRGDTVLVAPGRYYENVRFKGKGIVVTSELARTGDLGAIERTIIDGSRPAHPDTGTVVRFVNQEDSTAVLQGFTITGGTGTVWLDAKDKHLFREGGGILCELSSPTIRFNHIVGNAAVATGKDIVSAGGGGIRCGYAEPTIENNVVRDNRGRYGAGIVLFHAAGTVRNNLIAGNTGGEDFGGGGLWVVGNLSWRLSNVIEHNTIVGNRVTAPADSVRPGGMRGAGGGMISAASNVVMRHNVLWGNAQATGGQLDHAPRSPVILAHNLIQGGTPDRRPPATTTLAADATADADPRFDDPLRFTLAPDSPAVDAAPADASPDPARLPSPARGTRRADLGAYGGPHAARLIR